MGKHLTVKCLAGGISMSKKSFIDSVKVGNPCVAEWEKMHGNNRVRFCDHCAKDVNNLSAITRKEALRLVRSSDGNLCIRYIRNPVTQRPLFAEQLLQITRRTPSLAAGVMTASLTLSTISYSQSATPLPIPAQETAEVTLQKNQSNENKPDIAGPADPATPNLGSIEGVISDARGKPVPDVSIMLINAGSTDDVDYETTDSEGAYLFDELEAGTYIIRIASVTGIMKKTGPSFSLSEGQRFVQNLHVTVARSADGDGGEGNGSGWGFGGAMAAVEYSLPLSRAVADDDMETVRKLLSAGERVNGKDKNYDGITPLFLAVENGNVEMVRLLLDHGANVNAVDKTKRTPLMFIDSDASPALIEVLVKAGAKINAHDKEGNTALLLAISAVSTDVLDALIQAGANVNDADELGETPLMKATEENEIEAVKALVLAGAEINERDKGGESAWDKASKVEIEDYLALYGAITNYSTVQVPVPPEKSAKTDPIVEEEADSRF